MQPVPFTPRHNLGLHRLDGFVDRESEIQALKDWLVTKRAPAMLLSGPAGIGKSCLATAAAWSARDCLPGGIVWVSAAGLERFRREDVYMAIDAVVGSSIVIQPSALRTAAALQTLHAEPRLLVLDDLERINQPARPEIVNLIGQLAQPGDSKVLLIAATVPDAWRGLVGSVRLDPAPLSAAAIKELAETSAVPRTTVQTCGPVWDDLARWTRGHPLRCRLALGLASDHESCEGVKACVRALEAEPLEAWIAAALESLGRHAPATLALLKRIGLAPGAVSRETLHTLCWPDLGPPEEFDGALDDLAARGLVGRDDLVVCLHAAVSESLRQVEPLGDPSLTREVERKLEKHYVALAQEYLRAPREQWDEIDDEWPNIRHFANRVVDRFERRLGAPLEEMARQEKLPAVPPEEAATVESLALALMPVILWRSPDASDRWLKAGQIAARVLDHPHQAAQMEAALGGLCYLENEAECAVRHFRAARAAFEKLGDPFRLMETELRLGAVLRALGRHDEAIEAYSDAVELAEREGDQLDRATAYAQLGAAHYANGAPFRAIEWLHRARPALEESGGPALAALQNNLGLAYEAVGRYREAIEVYTASFELIEPSSRASQQQLATIAGNIGAAYYELGELEQALSWYRRDLALSQAIRDLAGTAATRHNIGHVLLEMGALPGAVAEFTSARGIYLSLGLTELADEEQKAIAHVQALTSDAAAQAVRR